MALLAPRGFDTPSLPAQGGQRRSPFLNISRDIPLLAPLNPLPHCGNVRIGCPHPEDQSVECIRGESYQAMLKAPLIWTSHRAKQKNLAVGVWLMK
jgi:hypothetical protein